MQLSQTLSSSIAQINVSNSPITNHIKKILSQRPPPFSNFCITYKRKKSCVLFNWGGLSGPFLPLVAVVVEERF